MVNDGLIMVKLMIRDLWFVAHPAVISHAAACSQLQQNQSWAAKLRNETETGRATGVAML